MAAQDSHPGSEGVVESVNLSAWDGINGTVALVAVSGATRLGRASGRVPWRRHRRLEIGLAARVAHATTRSDGFRGRWPVVEKSDGGRKSLPSFGASQYKIRGK
jgi:hypothetical protein